jgi:hypothetical protein
MPKWVPDPWETIGDELEARGLSYSDLPGEIQRDSRIGEAEAIYLSKFFGLSKEFWLDLQASRDRWKVENIANGKSPLAIDIEMNDTNLEEGGR